MKRHIANILLILCLGVSFSACEDVLPLPEGLTPIPEGQTRLTTEVRFTPLTEALADEGAQSRSGLEFGEGNTLAPTGSQMGDITSLYVLFYDTDGNLRPDIEPLAVDLNTYKPELEDREEPDASNGDPAEEKTYCVKFDITIPYGNYKIMAVANIDDLLTAHADDIKTIQGLRDIKLSWVSDNISKNREMLGYFTPGKRDTRGANFENEEPVYIRPETTSLHAWVRRAVSKLTIDFDGTGLRDNVYVYIKEARVYDIADGCYLGHYSCVGNAPESSDLKDMEVDIIGGFGKTQSKHRLTYGAGSEYEAWPVVTKGHKFDSYEVDGKTIKFHDETAYCLPFYENMQGNGMSKYQDSDLNGTPDYPDAGQYEKDENGNPVLNPDGSKKWLYEQAKDSKPNGTYVEVVGYYESKNEDYVTSGPIKYRFMLGKNIKDNYDCERNHHYKLTLRFKGHGNEADWHIEYEEAPGIYLPNPLYISYLYNRTINLPVRINTGGHQVTDIKAKITSNNWAPDIPDYNDRPVNDRLIYNRELDEEGKFGKKYPWNGFLSLIETHDTYITPPASEDPYKYNQIYYETLFTDSEIKKNVSRGERVYSVAPGEHTAYDKSKKVNLGNYTITKSRNVFECLLPLYTRAKQLVETTGYTGNNPFVAYERKAMVEVTATLDNGKQVTTSTEIIQVRRVVNPKGIYRDRGNNTSFNVELLELERESSTSFRQFESQGPWRAVIAAGDGGFIDLDGGQTVEGGTRTNIKFAVNFHGSCPEGQNRYAVIRVEYHNYNCSHLIFVCQGDDPVQLYANGPKWHTRNMKTKSAEVNNVLDEGSLFRFGKWDGPIDACNNNYNSTKKYWVNVTASDFSAKTNFKKAGNTNGTAITWDGIGSEAPSGSFSNPTINGVSCEVASVTDYYDLHEKTKQGYGILYGNSATGVQKDINMAYCYQRDENGSANGTYGMRGCFAYVDEEGSAYHGKHVFFPIGASGYGRRKHNGPHGGTWGVAEIGDGVLRYATGRVDIYNDATRPLFHDLFRRPGALYYAKTEGKVPGDNDSKLGLDINYFSFDFRPLSASNFYGGYIKKEDAEKLGIDPVTSPIAGNADACFVRCVTRK